MRHSQRLKGEAKRLSGRRAALMQRACTLERKIYSETMLIRQAEQAIFRETLIARRRVGSQA